MLRFTSSARTRELKKQLADSQPNIPIPVRYQASHEGDKAQFEDRVALDDFVFPEGCGPKLASFDEESTIHTTTDTEKDEGDKLENVPVSDISDLEKYDFVGSIWV